MSPQLQPLSYSHRNVFFYLLVGIFAAAIPFLFLYASGYRFDFGQTGFISTGGLYVAAEKTGSQIYINDALVRETRVFRRAFYSQGLEAGTHRVHVQKPEHHTWVKELPVYPHLVTEAQAFNLPLVPEVRLITPWRTAGGVAVITATSTVLENATATNQYLFEPRAATSTMVTNIEFNDLAAYFKDNNETVVEAGVIERVRATLSPNNATTTTAELATTTKEWRGVRLFEEESGIYAAYVGNRSSMPYYYCAEPFEPYQPPVSNQVSAGVAFSRVAEANVGAFSDEDLLEVQTVKDTDICEPIIRLDTNGEPVTYFDFFPNSTDLVVLGLESGIYLVEVDDRGWQNRQPLLIGEGLSGRVVNGGIYAYDGQVIYQVQISQNWF